jgi:hypothetical protein
MKPILCLDFDGVLHSYTSGWKGADVIPDPPTPGMVDFLNAAIEHFDVQIFSSRSHQPGGIVAMKKWLDLHVMHHFDCDFHTPPREFERALAILDAISYPTEKPAAMVTIDDRALCFDGNWSNFHPLKLKEFKPWNKRSPLSSSTAAESRAARLIRRIRMAWT